MKHLVYLGFTNHSHKVALFDDCNLAVTNVPIKDVKFPLNIDMLNCTVRNSQPTINLMGVKALQSCGKNEVGEYKYDGKSKFDSTVLWAFSGKEPEYCYDDYGVKKDVFLTGYLMFGFENYKIWDGSCKPENWYVLTASFALFYPYCEHSATNYFKHKLREYEFYSTKISDDEVCITLTKNFNIIHKFKCLQVNYERILRTIAWKTQLESEPCGVLRYADKLPNMHAWYYSDKGKEQVRDALGTSFFPILYGTKLSKRQVLGIDLHTGNFATANFTPTQYTSKHAIYWFPNVHSLRDIELHTPDWSPAKLLEKNVKFLSL